jgi:hypothetical protein
MKRGVKLLVSLSAVLLIPPPIISTASGDDCYTDCIIRYDCGTSHPWGGSSCYDLCKHSCQEEGWGAIAYSWKDKIYGWSHALDYKATAEKVAMQACIRQRGAHCIIQTSFYNACGAVAADGDLVAWGTFDTKAKAEQRALAECAKIGGKNCAVEVSVCSLPTSTSESHPASPPPPPKAIAWGAIAYSNRDMGAGWAQGKEDRASAEREAMSACSQRGKACVLRIAFNKGCGALAADRDFAGWGTAARCPAKSHGGVPEGRRHGLRAAHFVLLVLTQWLAKRGSCGGRGTRAGVRLTAHLRHQPRQFPGLPQARLVLSVNSTAGASRTTRKSPRQWRRAYPGPACWGAGGCWP